jgi:hypothetical protein
MLNLSNEQVVEVTTLADIHSQRDAFRQRRPGHSMLFRGQRSEWTLQTSLERACLEADGNLAQARIREAATIREFQRRYHHYAIHRPPLSHLLPWLSLMQHHGAPTRLLDWTYSIEVAAYFAVEYGWSEPKRDAAIWMMSAVWATRRTAQALLAVGEMDAYDYVLTGQKGYEDEEGFASAFMEEERAVPCVCPANPFMLNERLSLQKGVFTCVGDVAMSLEDNLTAMPGTNNPAYLMKLVIRHESLRALLAELYEVNISRATLFPGLDGFAQSLRVNLGSIPTRGEYPTLDE